MSDARSAAARLDRLPLGAFHRRTAALLAYVFFFELGDLNSFAYAAPALRLQWHLEIATIAMITSASFVGMFIGATTAGAFSDRVGRKRALLTTTIWYSVMSLFNACAWDVPSLFAARLLTGVGLSGMTVVGMTYIGEMFPSRVRGSYQAHILMLGLIGIPATAYVARFVIPVADWGWRVVFIWGSLAIFFPLFARHFEESPRWLEKRGRTAEADQVLTRIEREVGVAPADLAHPTESPAPDVERTGVAGLIEAGVGRRTVLLVAVWFCQTLALYGFNTWVPTLLAAQGFSIVETLQRSAAISIGAVPGAWIGEQIAERWQRKHIITVDALLVATFGMIYGLSFNTWIIVTFGFLVAMAQQTFAATLYAYTAECFPTSVRNSGAGLTYGIGRLGNVVGPLIVAFLFTTYGYRSVFAYIATCWIIVALLVLLFGPRMNQRSLV